MAHYPLRETRRRRVVLFRAFPRYTHAQEQSSGGQTANAGQSQVFRGPREPAPGVWSDSSISIPTSVTGHQQICPVLAELAELLLLLFAEGALEVGVGVHPGDEAVEAVGVEPNPLVAFALGQ